jgi:hypothetical protein
MKRLTLAALLAMGALVVPAHAGKPPKHNSHPPKSHKCQPHGVSYRAAGTLVSETLTQTAGGSTAKKSDDRYSGDLTVNVTKTNHHAQKGVQSYTLSNARVKFRVPDRSGDGARNQDDLRPGDRVKLKGKITKLAKKCDQTGFVQTITIRKVEFKPPKQH